MQAYNLAINDLDKELDHLKAAFELVFSIPRKVSVLCTREILSYYEILEGQ
ncbi:hypothetical protein Tco_1388594, partial [Tanacetum coccineum]